MFVGDHQVATISQAGEDGELHWDKSKDLAEGG